MALPIARQLGMNATYECCWILEEELVAGEGGENFVLVACTDLTKWLYRGSRIMGSPAGMN